MLKINKQKISEVLKKLFSNRKRAAVVTIAIIAVLGFGGWKIFSENKDETRETQTTQVEKGMIVASVSASGQVLSVNIISANTKASGIVSNVYVKDGDEVKKGDKILEIELDPQGQQKHTQAWSSYLSSKNSLESAKITQWTLQADMLDKWQDFKNLAESDTYKDQNSDNRNLPEFYISQNSWLAAEAKYKNQQAVISQSQAALSSSWMEYQLTSPVITAPADGTITSLMYAEGMSIGTLDTGNTTSNQKVATVKTEGTPIVSVNLSEIDVSRVEIGKKATVVLDSIEDKTFTGEVVGVDRIGETTSGVTQYPAIIRLDSSSEEILPNMTVTANIIIERKNDVLLVPSSAMQTQGSDSFVVVVKNGKQQSVPVETGLTSDTQTEIVSGVSEGDTIISGTLVLSDTQNGESPFGSSRMGIMRIPH